MNNLSDGHLKTTIRTVVKEELVQSEKRLEGRLDKRMDQKFEAFRKEFGAFRKDMGDDMTQKFFAMQRWLDKRLEEKLDEKLDEKLQPLRSEVLTAMENVMSELKDIREELTILSSQHHRVIQLETKVENLEKIHPPGAHAIA